MGFLPTSKVSTDEVVIEEILTRSIASVLPSKEELRILLRQGKHLRIYLGVDATGAQLHLGHATNFLLLEKLRMLGHEIIILFGDFTARIGDPTNKEAVRRQLSMEEVERNISDWKTQVSKVIRFSGTNPAKILRNSVWLSKLTTNELVDIAAIFTLQQMVERDMFENRIKEGKPIYLHEFLYPLLQGYDSVAMDVDVEVGGSDQTFNMLMGRTLQKKYHHKNKFVIATTLLEDPRTGKKLMSKSEGSYIALNDAPSEMFGKTMALPDGVVRQMFIDTTLLPMTEIEAVLQGHPKDAKMRLAREIVTLYHDKDAAKKAEENFSSTFSEGEIPEGIQTIEVEKNTTLFSVLIEQKLISSRSDFSRLLQQGAIKDLSTGEKLKDHNFIIEREITLRIGKHRFLKIMVN